MFYRTAAGYNQDTAYRLLLFQLLNLPTVRYRKETDQSNKSAVSAGRISSVPVLYVWEASAKSCPLYRTLVAIIVRVQFCSCRSRSVKRPQRWIP